MDRWVGKVAVVTGASSGIGEAIVEKLVENGLKVVGLARRKERLEEAAKKLSSKKGKCYPYKCDVSKEEDILNAFKWTKDNVGPVSILINNAGIVRYNLLSSSSTEDMKNILDTNVLGLCICTREAIKQMKDNNIDGHIININSVAGHKVVHSMNLNIYSASKFAVTALTETLRLELANMKSKIKMTSLSPGGVNTEIIDALNVPKEAKEKFIHMILSSSDIADTVAYVLATPPHVQISELTIQHVGEAF